MPVLVAIGEWGICWARQNMADEDYDVEFLMFYLERSVDADQLVGDETVIQFSFTDLKRQKNWWIVVRDGLADLCIKDPNKDVDLFITTTVRTMTHVWMGDRTYREAVKSGDLEVQGPSALTRNINVWLRPSIFKEAPRTPAAETA
jgi:alkyl sulfatase BDS1-like metallo-beta-lactamase superfamily hydrolase